MASSEKSIGQAKGRTRSGGERPAAPSRSAVGSPQATGDGVRGDLFGQFARRYQMALQNYLLHPDEVFLQMAYELGRQAVAEGVGILNLFRIHSSSVQRACEGDREKVAAAEAFLMEALSPFEATHRGFRETNAKLSELNAALAKRNNELGAMNFELQREIEERKRTEAALRQTKEHYRLLFNDARVMQENLRHLSNRVLCIQEEERKRISRELHDEVGQSLTAVNVHLAVAEKSPSSAAQQIADARQLVEQTMEIVHRFARELRPAMLDDLGLAAALRAHIKAFSERAKMPVHFEADPVIEHLSDGEKVAMYRVVQEALTNIARHANATEARVIFRATRVAVRLEISDNGKSFSIPDNQATQKRLGLLGMQERVRLVNGTFHIDSREGKGTTIRVDLPLPRQAAHKREAQLS